MTRGLWRAYYDHDRAHLTTLVCISNILQLVLLQGIVSFLNKKTKQDNCDTSSLEGIPLRLIVNLNHRNILETMYMWLLSFLSQTRVERPLFRFYHQHIPSMHYSSL